MDYTVKETSNWDDDITEVREPVAVYAVGGAMAGIGGKYGDFNIWSDDAEDEIDDVMLPSDFSAHSLEDLYGKLEEAKIAREAGLVYTSDEIRRHFGLPCRGIA